jgi:hypothetical protein
MALARQSVGDVAADEAGAARDENHPKGPTTRLLCNGKSSSSMPLIAWAGSAGMRRDLFALRNKPHLPQHS